MTEEFNVSSPLPIIVDEQQFIENLDFILSHFEDAIWPRKISTKTTQNKQILVFNKEEALTRFRQANFIDCRINAYPDYTEYNGINRQAPNFIFAELDKSTFKTDRALKIAYNRTLNNFSNKLNVSSPPTVISSGSGGFHFYQPIKAFVLEQEEFFLSKSANGEPSKEFLRFAEQYLTGYKSDPSHCPSLKSCLLRIPGSINSKCNKQVQIVQRWDGFNRPKINLLLYEFSRWLIYNRVKDREVKTTFKERSSLPYARNSDFVNTINKQEIAWIELLLQHPLPDYRKRCLWRILAPYLINVRKLSYEQSASIMREWLDRCNQIQRLNFNARSVVKEKLANVGEYYPIGLEKLKQEFRELYNDIVVI
jgi:Primase X